jgi:hypothetical protein
MIESSWNYPASGSSFEVNVHSHAAFRALIWPFRVKWRALSQSLDVFFWQIVAPITKSKVFRKMRNATQLRGDP